MQPYSFTAEGHKNVLATHKTTLEFTTGSNLTKDGDCIIAVNADFSLPQLQRFLSFKKIRITVAAGGIAETITAIPNRNFSSSREMVIRMGEFASERTFAVRADKAAVHLSRELIESLKNGYRATITVSEIM